MYILHAHCRGVQLNAPTIFLIRFSVIFILLLALGCEESERWVEDPSEYLETTEFPGYFQRIPWFGVNGHNGLKPPEKGSHCSVYGVYVSSIGGCFVRTFSDSVIFHIPLKESLPYPSECTIVKISGKVVHNGEPSLSEVEIGATEEIGEVYRMVVEGYPKLIDKIAGKIHNPKSRLDLKSIEIFHCAVVGNKLLIMGRTYDLMYEFDLGFLFEKEDNSYKLKKIFTREFFKGE